MSSSGTLDIETGTNGNLNPTMTESPLPWGFIGKVYAILPIQLFLTVAVGAMVVTLQPNLTIADAVFLYMIFLIISLISKVLVLMLPGNYVLLAIITIALASEPGLACFSIQRKGILKAAILTTVVVVSLTLLTFWSPKRGHDVSFLGPFLFAALIMFIVFGLIQASFPMGELTHTIYWGISALVFCGYIVFYTFDLIKLDDYISTAIALFVDGLYLFLVLLVIFGVGDT